MISPDGIFGGGTVEERLQRLVRAADSGLLTLTVFEMRRGERDGEVYFTGRTKLNGQNIQAESFTGLGRLLEALEQKARGGR